MAVSWSIASLIVGYLILSNTLCWVPSHVSIRLNKPYHCASVWYPRTYSIRPRSSHFQANTTFRSGRYLKHCLAHRRLFDIVVNQLMLGTKPWLRSNSSINNVTFACGLDIVVNQLMLGTKPWLRSNSSINNVTFACGLLAMFMASRTEGRGACCSAHPIRPMRLLVEMRKWPGISLKFTAIGASYVPGVDSHNDDDLLHKQCNSANIRPWPINNVILPTFARGLLAMFMASRTGCWIVFIHLLLHSY